MSRILTLETDFEWVTCGACGVIFGIPQPLYRQRRRDHKGFWCPNGHERCFVGESDVEKLQRELKAQQRVAKDAEMRAEMIEEQHRAATRDLLATKRKLTTTKTQLTKTKNRIAHGVCPCCNRHFVNLERHMQGQHPTFTETNPDAV